MASYGYARSAYHAKSNTNSLAPSTSVVATSHRSVIYCTEWHWFPAGVLEVKRRYDLALEGNTSSVDFHWNPHSNSFHLRCLPAFANRASALFGATLKSIIKDELKRGYEGATKQQEQKWLDDEDDEDATRTRKVEGGVAAALANIELSKMPDDEVEDFQLDLNEDLGSKLICRLSKWEKQHRQDGQRPRPTPEAAIHEATLYPAPINTCRYRYKWSCKASRFESFYSDDILLEIAHESGCQYETYLQSDQGVVYIGADSSQEAVNTFIHKLDGLARQAKNKVATRGVPYVDHIFYVEADVDYRLIIQPFVLTTQNFLKTTLLSHLHIIDNGGPALAFQELLNALTVRAARPSANGEYKRVKKLEMALITSGPNTDIRTAIGGTFRYAGKAVTTSPLLNGYIAESDGGQDQQREPTVIESSASMLAREGPQQSAAEINFKKELERKNEGIAQWTANVVVANSTSTPEPETAVADQVKPEWDTYKPFDTQALLKGTKSSRRHANTVLQQKVGNWKQALAQPADISSKLKAQAVASTSVARLTSVPDYVMPVVVASSSTILVDPTTDQLISTSSSSSQVTSERPALADVQGQNSGVVASTSIIDLDDLPATFTGFPSVFDGLVADRTVVPDSVVPEIRVGASTDSNGSQVNVQGQAQASLVGQGHSSIGSAVSLTLLNGSTTNGANSAGSTSGAQVEQSTALGATQPQNVGSTKVNLLDFELPAHETLLSIEPGNQLDGHSADLWDVQESNDAAAVMESLEDFFSSAPAKKVTEQVTSPGAFRGQHASGVNHLEDMMLMGPTSIPSSFFAQAISSIAAGDEVVEKLQEYDEVGTRVFHKTMNQKAPRSSIRKAMSKVPNQRAASGRLPLPSPPRVRSSKHTDDGLKDPTSEFGAEITTKFNALMSASRLFCGRIVVRLEFGRIISTNFSDKVVFKTAGDRVHGEKYLHTLFAQSTKSTFTNILACQTSEIEYLIGLKDKSDESIWSQAQTRSWTVTYEFVFQDVTDLKTPFFRVGVNGETFATRLSTETQLGSLFVHGALRQWDYRIAATGYGCTEAAKQRYSAVKKAIETTLSIPENLDTPNLSWEMTPEMYAQFNLKDVQSRRSFFCTSKDGKSVLELTEVQNLMGPAVLDPRGVYKFNAQPIDVLAQNLPEGVFRKATTWWEAAIQSPTLNTLLNQNQGLKVAEEPQWTASSLAELGLPGTLYKPACEMLRQMDAVGQRNDNGVSREMVEAVSKFFEKPQGNEVVRERDFW